MSMWTCKKCGQVYDDMFCGDYICDDCFDKMKREEKKQKQRNTPFFRVLSFALALSFMLCIFSGIGVASAEDIPTDLVSVVDGKYKGYDCISFSQNQVISSDYLKALYDGYKAADESINMMYVYLLGFDSSGVPHSYSPFGYGCQLLSFQYDANGDFRTSFYLDTVENANGDSYDYVYYGYNATSAYIHYKLNTSTIPEIYSYNFSFTDGSSGFDGLCSEQMYLVFVPFNTSATDYRTILPSLLAGDYSTDYAPSVTPSTAPQANFYTCKSAPFTDSSHGLYIKSWLKDGNQYPYFGWWINDNGNNHKYKVVFSYNDTQRGLFEAFYQSTKQNPAFSNGWWIEHAFPILAITKDNMLVANTIAKETGFADFMADKTWWLWHYNTLFTLDHSSMDFTNSESGNKAYSINLSDYSAIYEYLFYRAQIVDVTTGNILDTVYFTSQETYSKSDSGYGSKVYVYGDDFNGMLNDLTNNTPSVTPDNQGNFNVDGDIIGGGILDENGNLNYDFNIGQIVGTLNNATAGMGQFFSACMNIIPGAFISILMGSFALIVLLRILGR